MSIARHHADWLSLVETSGPFLSLPVLMEAFPAGLEPHAPDHHRVLRFAHGEWEERRDQPATHSAWVKFVLGQSLDYPAEVLAEGQAIPQAISAQVPECGEHLTPDFVLHERGDRTKPRLLVQTYPPTQDLSRPVPGLPWKASPDTRMTHLLHATGVRLGLVTNGERWMLVNAPPGETTGFASWYATLWLEEPITFRAFRSLLGVQRFFGVTDKDTPEQLLARSAANQQEVTDQLGNQVRRAVEVLIHSFDRADQDSNRELLGGVREPDLYEAALTVMMRLVFLFCAEERGLIAGPADRVFWEHYSVSTIHEQLQQTASLHGPEILERRYDAWCRLLVAFRAVHGGVRHDQLKLPAYGGNLFDPDRFPFLEGRKARSKWRDTEAQPLPVNNRTVLHLLESLQTLETKLPGDKEIVRRRLSFRSLDIEQIGHVYEGLLDHTARRADAPYLGLIGAKGQEPEVPLAALEDAKQKGDKELLAYLKDATGRTEAALKKLLAAAPGPQQQSRLRAACHNDDALLVRVRPFAGVVRPDSFGYPAVIPTGSVYVTEGTDRRSSGTHYTPRSLTEPIVQYTLEPLVYVGPAEGLPRGEWKLKPAKELLDLKICDIACGSGAFLVQACRYMAERLQEAWQQEETRTTGQPRTSPEGMPSAGRLTERVLSDDRARQVEALRLVAQRCLYGVDKNPLAVEMAKLSLWLLTLAKGMPFEFLDHAIRCGDSLVGIHRVEQLQQFTLNLSRNTTGRLTVELLNNDIVEAIALRRRLMEMVPNDVAGIEEQARLEQTAREKLAKLRAAADMLVGAEFLPWELRDLIQDEIEHDADSDKGPDWMRAQKETQAFRDAARTVAATTAAATYLNDPERLQNEADNWLNSQVTFHWPLEFPEVFAERGGFDAMVGNPPFVGGRRIRSTLGGRYLDFLTKTLFPGASGNADLCAFFFRRAYQLLLEPGGFGLIGTNTIAQGDTRASGLGYLEDVGATIIRAVPNRPWPGEANVQVSQVWVRNTTWSGPHWLDNTECSGISSYLTIPGSVTGRPHALKCNQLLSYQGSVVLGMGFVLTVEEAVSLIERDRRNSDVVMPYLDGDDLNTEPDQSGTRWVINFFDWPLDRKSARAGYSGPVASDYPDCLSIIEQQVKPERTRRNANGEFVLRKPLPQKWWIYADKRPELYKTIKGMTRVLVTARVSPTCAVDFVPTTNVFHEKVIVFPVSTSSYLATLQSSLHWSWARMYTSTRGSVTLNYSPTDCFDTYPLPRQLHELEEIGTCYHAHRRSVMSTREEGLTSTYNRFHDPQQRGGDFADIDTLRQLHIEMDLAVAAAYGWSDLPLGHDFHETKQGIRFTISEAARREVLARLLKLNHDRYAEEVKQGLHDKKKPKAVKKPKKAKTAASAPTPQLPQVTLFDGTDTD